MLLNNKRSSLLTWTILWICFYNTHTQKSVTTSETIAKWKSWMIPVTSQNLSYQCFLERGDTLPLDTDKIIRLSFQSQSPASQSNTRDEDRSADMILHRKEGQTPSNLMGNIAKPSTKNLKLKKNWIWMESLEGSEKESGYKSKHISHFPGSGILLWKAVTE